MRGLGGKKEESNNWSCGEISLPWLAVSVVKQPAGSVMITCPHYLPYAETVMSIFG
jgi:hypothetical protein